MRKTLTIAATGLAVLAVCACRQEPTAKPVDDGTDVAAQAGATPDAATTPTEAATTPAATTGTAAPATPTPEALATPTP